MQRRIKRDFRRGGPKDFLSFNLNVRHSLTNNLNYPDSAWGASLALRQQHAEKVTALETAYRLASNGDRILIRERDKLMEELILILDEMASFLEALSTRNPDALYTTGFSIAQERRNHRRTRLPLTSPLDFMVTNTGEPRKAVASASSAPGAYNHEIHINTKDPAVETDWFHKSMFPDAKNMVLENLNTGNTFFRMRHHGPDGPGPWSSITSVLIT
ncbi:hypothetical protein JFN90_03475 [Geomonas sp. Red259]|uniref:Uncharacterized protein n=1 Tax=Geomonas propionica TaxID=2798582 RepID=A0ABS0YMQ0_9BACT|nr:hypothetical protein [Geomonas propionica]